MACKDADGTLYQLAKAFHLGALERPTATDVIALRPAYQLVYFHVAAIRSTFVGRCTFYTFRGHL